jgi:hypothetical protein
MRIQRFCTRSMSSDSAVVRPLCHAEHAYSSMLRIISQSIVIMTD